MPILDPTGSKSNTLQAVWSPWLQTCAAKYRCPFHRWNMIERIQFGVFAMLVLIAAVPRLTRTATAQENRFPGKIRLTKIDSAVTHYATFQSHNQKVVANQYGVFTSHVRDRDFPYLAQTWRLPGHRPRSDRRHVHSATSQRRRAGFPVRCPFLFNRAQPIQVTIPCPLIARLQINIENKLNHSRRILSLQAVRSATCRGCNEYSR